MASSQLSEHTKPRSFQSGDGAKSRLISAASSHPYDCVSGISQALSLFTLASSASSYDYYTEICTNPLLVTSQWAAAQLYCSPDEIAAGQEYLNDETCVKYGGIELIGYDEVKGNLTDDFIKNLTVVGFGDIKLLAGTTFNSSVLVDRALVDISIKTVNVYSDTILNHKKLGWGIYGFWGIVLLAGMINRLLQNISSRKPLSSPGTGMLANIHHWTRTNLIIPASFGSYHQRLLYYCTIPTRLETLVLTAFYILTIILCSVAYNVFYPNVYYTSQLQGWRYFSDRTGILSYACLPILWLFAGRNKIFLSLTTYKYSTFNVFHRHIARVAIILAIAHSVGYTVFSFIEEGKAGYYASFKENYWYMGVIATVAMSLIPLGSSIWLRIKSYEVFLVLHILLSVVIIVALFYHTWIFADKSYDPYLWPLVAIWGFDRLARVLRQLYVNIHVKSSGLSITKGTVTYDTDADLITLMVSPGRKVKPGNNQHYFIYQYDTWRGWENHPFSLASWSTSNSSTHASPTASLQPPAIIKTKSPIISTAEPTSPSPSKKSISSSSSADPSITGLEMTFYIRPTIGGFTGRLKAQCLAHSCRNTDTSNAPDTPLSLNLILEGPCGHSLNTHPFSKFVLIAGGSGIAGLLPFLDPRHQEQEQKNQAIDTEIENGRRTKQEVKLIWAARRSAMIESMMQNEKEGIFDLLDPSVDSDFYSTGYDTGNGAGKYSQLTTRVDDDESIITIKQGRPDIAMLIRDEVCENGAGNSRVAVIVCGPAGMADQARATVHALLKEGVRGLEYVEEGFGW